jgi:hypothetical protein
MDKKDLTASVAQAIAVHVQDKTRIITTLVATTDRVGSEVSFNAVTSELKDVLKFSELPGWR